MAKLKLTLACVVLIVVGQLMMKAAAGQWHVDGLSWSALRAFFSPIMIAALVLYGFATLLWVYVLRTVPLSSAYAMFSLAFVIVPVPPGSTPAGTEPVPAGPFGPARSVVLAVRAHAGASMATRSAAMPREPYAFTEPSDMPSVSATWASVMSAK